MRLYQCLVFSIMLLISAKSMAGTIPLEIDAEGKNFSQYPVAVGVPFPENEECLDSISSLKLSSIGGEEIPFQVHELCKWKNGKIKAALVQFLADTGTYKVDYGVGISNGGIELQPRVNVINESEYVEVNTGVLRFRINKICGKLFDGIWLNGVKIVENGDMEVIGVDGQSYQSSNYRYIADEVRIEEGGPIRSCIMIRGKYVADNNAANDFRYIVRVYAYAGKGFLKISHTIIDEDSTANREIRIKGYNLHLKHLLPDSVCRLGKEISGYQEKQVTEECSVYQGTFTYSGNIGSGTRAAGWIDINNGTCGITAAVRYFWQNCPKGFVVNNDAIKIWLHPDNAEGNFLGVSGIAKTHNIMLSFNSVGFNQGAVEQQVSLFNYNIFPKIPSEWYCNSGVFGKILPGVVGDSIPISTNYGYKKFGDSLSCHRYVEQDPGNQELLYYIQDSKKKEYFDTGEIRFHHAADMHIIHAEYAPIDDWGEYTWGQKSVRGGCRGYETGCGVLSYDDRRHAQVAGAGVYYLLTGDKWAEEVIKKCGDCRYENLVNIPDKMSNYLVGVGQERETGVTLWRALQAYNATEDKKYLVGMSESVKGLVGNQKNGFWMQHQSSSGPRFLGKGYYWDNSGNYCKYLTEDYQQCKIAVPWMSAYLFAPLVEYDKLNKYYNLVDTVSVENMLIGCMEHLIKYTGAEENGRIGFRREGCVDWEVDYLSCRLAYPVVYLRKLSGNQNWDRLIGSLLDKTWSERGWFYSEAERMYQEYQQTGINNVQIDTTKDTIVNISWVNNSESINRLIYGTQKFDGNVKNGTECTVSGNSCELNNLIHGTVYYFQFITISGKRTWMYTFKTKGGIDDVNFTDIGDRYVGIKWTTDFNGNSIVEYATDDEWLLFPGQYSHFEKNTDEIKNHTISLTGLEKATGYHIRVKSQGEGYSVTSEDYTFSTEGGISGINAYPVDENSAVITFLTWPGPYYLYNPYQAPIDDIEVCYGTSKDNLFNSVKIDFGVWGVVLRRLQSNTTYYYKVKINYRWTYSSIVSPTYTFFTQKGYEKPLQRLLCDFGRKDQEVFDGKIDFEDLMWFTIYWNAYQANSQDLRGDVAGSITTTSGQAPNLSTQPDGIVNFDDLMVFSLMWKWFEKMDNR